MQSAQRHRRRDRRRRLHRLRHRQKVRARGLHGLRRPAHRGETRRARRDEIESGGGRCEARALDARKEEDVTAFLNEADAHAPLEVCIFNPGANVNFPILETTERVFRKVWEMACYGGFLTGREAARLHAAARQGHDPLHRRDGQLARRQGLCGLRQRQVRPARRGAEHGARAGPDRTSTSRISSSMPASTPLSCASASRLGAARLRWPTSSPTS